MKSDLNKIWFSFSSNGAYNGSEPPFFDIEHTNWYKLLKNNYLSIQKELLTADEQKFIPYYNRTFANQPTNWKILPFKFWLLNYKKNQKKFPITTNIVKQIPYLVSASFSQLSKQTQLKPHTGDSNAMYRVHLPLLVPAKLPDCGFKVLDNELSWHEGVPFAFCDAHLHLAWNNTNEKRIVLILDIIRPEFQHKTKWISAQMLASLLIQYTLQKTTILQHVPAPIRKWMMNTFAVPVYVFTRIRSFIIK